MTERMPIPHYFLYEEDGEVELDFLQIEAIHRRSGAHDWTIKPHAHPHHAQFLYVAEGGGEIRIEDRPWTFQRPCLIIIPAAMVHEIAFQPGTDGWAVTAAVGYVDNVAQGDRRLIEATGRPGVFAMDEAVAGDTDVAAAFPAMLREFVFSTPGRRPAIRAHFLTVLVALLRAQARQAEALPAAGDRDYALVLRYRELIEASFRQEKRLEFYADRLGVTPARLNAACRVRLGTTASAMLHDRLMTEAKRGLIYTAWTVAEVGYALGFEDPAYFNRFFSKRAGMSPGLFREHMAIRSPA